MDPVPVAVFGATGTIGQRFVSLLQDHPRFRIAALCASDRRVGSRYGDAWRLPDVRLADDVAAMAVEELSAADVARRAVVGFSALPAEVARKLEPEFVEQGVKVFSNASAHRMDETVPLLVPEVNADHVALVERQPRFRDGGFLVTNPNCSITGLGLPLKPLRDALRISRAFVATYQALSGAGYPGVPSLDIAGNVIPFIEREEEKIRTEARKILGALDGGRVAPADIEVFANCARVPVRDGHLEAVSIPLEEEATAEGVARLLADFRGVPQRRGLPTAPDRPVIVRPEPDRPQPVLDVDAGEPERARGMAATVGRIRVEEGVLRFFVLAHNTIRGGAGGSVLNAELADAMGYLE